MDFAFSEQGFSYGHTLEHHIENKKFILHNHVNSHEIFIFLQGDAEFLVEGTRYPLHPYDIILAQNSEMHYVHHKDLSVYERIVINIDNNFFIKHNCEAYKEIFTNRPLGVNNCISASAAAAYDIPGLLKRMENYLADTEDHGTAALGAMLEFLYLLNHIGVKSQKSAFHHEQIKEIILYINNHLTEPLPLDEIAEHFYMTKCHLCRIFKKHTGYTVNQYITHKRLILVRELADSGMSWTEASEASGFGNYSNFYKLFCRTYGHSPTHQKNLSIPL